MALLEANVGDTVQYRSDQGKTSNVLVTGTQPSTPSAPGVTASESGGTLDAATYSYRITTVVGGAESVASPEASDTIATGPGSVEVALPGNDGEQYAIYGRTAGDHRFMALSAPGATSFVDDGSIDPSGNDPAASVSADGRIGALQFHPKRTLGRTADNDSSTVLTQATEESDTDVYFKRGGGPAAV